MGARPGPYLGNAGAAEFAGYGLAEKAQRRDQLGACLIDPQGLRQGLLGELFASRVGGDRQMGIDRLG
jgi:hypothetical protein